MSIVSRTSILGFAAFAVAGCTTIPAANVEQNIIPISYPPLGVETEARLGDDLLVQGVRAELEGVQLSEPNNVRGYPLPAGFYPRYAEDDEYSYHTWPDNTDPRTLRFYGNTIIKFAKNKRQTCVVSGGIVIDQCDTEKPYRNRTITQSSAEQFQQTLVYAGRAGDIVRFVYNESSNGMARPAFTIEVEYDLSQSNVVGFRGAELEIIDATNTDIKYVARSNFNTPQ